MSQQSAEWFMDITGRILPALGQRTRPQSEEVRLATGRLQGFDALCIFIARAYAPEPLIIDHLITDLPYNNPASWPGHVQGAVERGWLLPAGAHAYQPTDEALTLFEFIYSYSKTRYAAVEPVTGEEMQRIIALLDRVIAAAFAAPEPPPKDVMQLRRRFVPGEDGPLLMRLRRRLLAMWSYRDDCHLAAWRPYDVPTHAWEALTIIWRGPAATPAGVAEQLAHRAYDEAAYTAALQLLVDKGWLAVTEDTYSLTETGRAAREAAEETTSHYFNPPWTVLSNSEINELQGLLTELADGLTVDSPSTAPVRN